MRFDAMACLGFDFAGMCWSRAPFIDIMQRISGQTALKRRLREENPNAASGNCDVDIYHAVFLVYPSQDKSQNQGSRDRGQNFVKLPR